MTIGDKITFFRKRLGISQEEMASRLGMTSQGYGKIERDETDVPHSRLELICKALGTTLQDLVNYGERNVSNNSNAVIGNFGNNSTYQICSDQVLAQENTFLKRENQLLQDKIQHLEELLQVYKQQKATQNEENNNADLTAEQKEILKSRHEAMKANPERRMTWEEAKSKS
jgi:transcriptional regulator with XRE-family HTH domain